MSSMNKNGKRIERRAAALIGVVFGGWLYMKRKKSTIKLARFHGGRVKDFIHSYFYYKWTSLYIRPVKFVLERPGVVPTWLYRGAGNRLMQTHHAKVITNETAKRLIDIKQPINVSNPEQVLPFERARDIVLENSDHIAVVDCPCRQIAENPCHPIDVCFVLGEPLVDFVLEHKQGNARKVDTAEALSILQREHERGRVHTAWFKDAAGDRLYSICNCCGCCCLGLRALSFGFEQVASSGYTAEVNYDACAACGDCASACHFDAITIEDQVEIDEDKCKGCGVCVKVCLAEAVSLKEDACKPGPLLLS